ncbi:MAG TPA: branched-chain amino acid ABC transporter substrate-binding protein [Actinomycetota bacterium]|nr:branched-chain amino acid ABC transporter substrate-binding protein [Actinomycetota bacterium]
MSKRPAVSHKLRRGRRGLAGSLSFVVGIFGAGACSDDPQPRAERCVWEIGTIASDAAEPGFSGIPVLQGLRFGITRANRERLPCRLELVEISAARGKELRDAAADLTARDRMVAVVGPYSSAALETAMPSFAAADIPVLAPTAARAALDLVDRSRFFRLIATDESEGEAAGRYLDEVAGAERVVLVRRDSGYTRALSDALSRTLGPVLVDADEAEQDEPFDEVIGAVQKAEPDAIFFAGPGAELAELAAAASAAELDVLFAGPSIAKDPGLLGLSEAQGAVIFCSCADPASSSDSELRRWATDFQKEIGEAPGPFAIEAFESIQLVAAALADSGLSRESSPEELRESIPTWAHSHSWPGLTKTYGFDTQGELGDPPVFVYQVSGSGWREVGRVDDLTG